MPDLSAADVPAAVEAADGALRHVLDGAENTDMSDEAEAVLDTALPALRAALRKEWEAEQDTEWGWEETGIADGLFAGPYMESHARAVVANSHPGTRRLVRRAAAGPWVEVSE